MNPISNSQPQASWQWQPQLPTPCQPHANVATIDNLEDPNWVLNSGASHHVTIGFSNLSVHAPYSSVDDVVIKKGTGLHIFHIGSASRHTPSYTCLLCNVLCVAILQKNLISISKICRSDGTSIEFLAYSFLVKELRTRIIFTSPN